METQSARKKKKKNMKKTCEKRDNAGVRERSTTLPRARAPRRPQRAPRPTAPRRAPRPTRTTPRGRGQKEQKEQKVELLMVHNRRLRGRANLESDKHAGKPGAFAMKVAKSAQTFARDVAV